MKELFHINTDIHQHVHVIIYGAGWSGKKALLKLLQHDIKVHCFADSDPDKCGTLILNIPVVHIDELVAMKDSAAVIVCGTHALTIAGELEKRGFSHLYFDYGNEADVVWLKGEGR